MKATAGALGLAIIFKGLLDALQNIDFGAPVWNKANDNSSSATSTPSTPSNTSNCEPTDPNCKDKPKECTGEPGFGLKVSGGDGRLGNSLKNIPLANIGANEAFRLLQFFEHSVKVREVERAEYRSRGTDIDKGHKKRLNEEREVRDRLKKKSDGHEC